MFVRNEGTPDRILRGVAGLVLLLAAVLVLHGLWQWVAGVVGLVLLVTGASGICPAYRLLGINTCPVQTDSSTR